MGRPRRADAGGGRAPDRRLPLPRARGRGRARRDPPSEDRILRRLPLPDPPRHRLPGQRARVPHPGRSTSSWAAVSGDRSPRDVAVDRADRRDLRPQHALLGEGPAALLHRIVDTMVDNYRPEVDKLQSGSTRSRRRSSRGRKPTLVKRILDFKRDVASLRRVIAAAARRRRPAGPPRVPADLRAAGLPVSRRPRPPRAPVRRGDLLPGPHHGPARRAPVDRLEPAEQRHEGPDDHLDDLHAADRADRHVRHERPLPHLPGGDAAQFWWIVGIMAVVSGVMLWFFRRKGWL